MEVAPMILRAAGLAGVLLMVGAESSAFANDPSFFGEWARGDGKAHIRIERCSGQVFAINTWAGAVSAAKRPAIGLL
jgi:uncharacterized protein (DUF2147 family)